MHFQPFIIYFFLFMPYFQLNFVTFDESIFQIVIVENKNTF